MNERNPTETDPILDCIADGVFTVDREWVITSFNKSAEIITGISRSEAIGRKCWEVFHADVCERECLLKKTMKTNRQCVNKTIQIINKKGIPIPISISTAILKDHSGAVIGGVETFRDLSEIEKLRKEISGKHTFADIITKDHQLLTLFDSLPAIAHSDTPVLLLGESGTGKELFAKAIHSLSSRCHEPFIPVNCGALPENLMESELFGYRRGAFTDAKNDKPGRFDRAQHGTLFLDEIGDLQKSLQVKLLRVLQEKVYEPLGATTPVVSDVRIIAATNRNLEHLVETEQFRQDLYYRINVIPLFLPPLRQRQGDIALLIDHFISHYNKVYRKSIERICAEVMSMLLKYSFPGNIRELENIVQHAFVLCQGHIIEKKHIPDYLTRSSLSSTSGPGARTWEDFEKTKIEKVLETNKYNRTKAAQELGVHVATLWRKMKKYAIHI
ncbi:MAG: sigma 54-interacting transcriptional regulator [Chitinivibrionales bacterium]|nr:sigma 54-interacting transcriptional regulator [Chitinivibrionales bacterium]